MEEGFHAEDAVDGDVTDSVVREETDGNIYYTATDSSGNSTTIIRNVVYTDLPNYDEKKVVYLTFDDGPDKYTTRLLEILDNYNVNETVTKEGSGNGSIVSGEREDKLFNTTKVSPFDSENFYNDTTSDGSTRKGAETDTTSNAYNETVTSNKKGNIGVQTGADMLGKHTNYWKNFDFYNLVFSEIAKELLLV